MSHRVSPLALALFGLGLIAGAGPIAVCVGDEELARELPRIRPLNPGDALSSFRIHRGFGIVPVAVEPVVSDPVSLCYDADGRIYVVEMRGYPYPEKAPSGHVRRLEDRDGDGRYETSTIFVDGLSWPTGVVPYDGGVFIAAAPDILYAKDIDGDGVADIKKGIFTGFGTQNVQALLNGLLWGPDGWIYGVSGGNGGEIRNLNRPDARPISVRGRDFRFWPDGSVFEAISGGGQFGHAFDDWGHRFTCNNSNHIRQIVLPARYLERNPALMVTVVVDDIAAEGPAAPVFRISPAEPWRVVRTRQRAADPAMARRLAPTELVPTGYFTSATGVTVYRGTAFPPEFRGNAFIGDVGGNLVHRKVLTRNGAEFRASRADQGVEFLASTDNWFRPVNFANTPDGTLLVLDMYRETIEHPASIPEPIKRHLDLTSGKNRGRIYEVVPQAFRRRRRFPLSTARTADLVALLADRDAWWRETAQRLLIERKDRAALPLLKKLAADRPNALARVHALWTLDTLKGLEPGDLLPALRDAEPGVREQSARLTEGRTATFPELVEPLLALADDPDAMVRFQAAFSLGDVSDSRAIAALARIAVKDGGDRWVRAAVLSSVAGRAGALMETLAATPRFFDSPLGRTWLEDLASLIGAEDHPPQIQATLARFGDADPGRLSAIVRGLGRGLRRTGGSLCEVLEGSGDERLATLFSRAATVAGSEGPVEARVDAIRLLGLGPLDPALKVLPGLLDARQPVEVQLATLRTIDGWADPRVGPLVIAHWAALSPPVRREAIEVLFERPDRLATLLEAIESKTVAPSDLDAARRKQLLEANDPAIRERAVKLLGPEARSDRGQAIAANRGALTLAGNPDRAIAVFDKTCATCHKAEGRGADVGPNLATVANRSPEDLLIHILDPNREVAPVFLNYNVATTDGRVVSGIIAEESANDVTLKRAEGVTEVIPRHRIETIASTGLSLMPEGLERGLQPQDLADLIAFVRGLQAPGPVPGR